MNRIREFHIGWASIPENECVMDQIWRTSMPQDLTKIARPLGELDDETAAALFLAWRRGEQLLVYDAYLRGWMGSPNTNPFLRNRTYRLAPQPVTYDQINWSHVHPDIKYIARDADGTVWGFSHKPDLRNSFWAGENNTRVENRFASYIPGTCDWRDSLITRPEGT